MALPILILDERSLSPRFGYVFDAGWLEPHESILGMLWKFVRAKQPPAATVVAQIGSRPVDGYAGLRPCFPDVDPQAVARLLGIRCALVRQSMPDYAARADLTWCPSCLGLGYHSVVHQYAGQGRCPIHGSLLRQHCKHCGRASAYWLDAQLLDATFRCRHCRVLLCASASVSSLGKRRLRPEL